MKGIKEDLATRYGFCSPESSLLMLYEVDQFLENDVLPPVGHPVWADTEGAKELKKRQTRTFETDLEKQPGKIGGPKSDSQKANVVKLADKLNGYFNSPIEELPARLSDYADEEEDCDEEGGWGERCPADVVL
jgi:hypothetical protein